MTDQELSSLGERLYGAIIAARLSEPALEDLSGAISARRPWAALAERTKIAVFVVATQMSEPDNPPLEESPDPPPRFDSAPDVPDPHALGDASVGTRDFFGDSVEVTGEETSSIRHEAQMVDTSDVRESSNPPLAQPVLNTEASTADEAVDKDDEPSSEDADSGTSRVLGKSRRKSSS